MNTILTEIRNAFGFPEFIAVAAQEEKQTSNTQPNNYSVNCGDGMEDYFDQLGAAV